MATRWRLWPAAITGQIAVLVLIAIAAIHVVLTATFWFVNRADPSHPAETTGRMAALVEIIDSLPPAERSAEMGRLMRAYPQFRLGLASPGSTLDETSPEPRVRHLARAIGPRFTVTSLRDRERNEPGHLAVRLPDGWSLLATLPPDRAGAGGPLITTLAFLIFSTVLLGGWAVLALTRPLRGISAAVEAYGPGEESRPIPETGPREIRSLARAFNAMQGRIASLMAERTRAFAAVSHDLRTPITRLRLRAENVEDPQERARFLADLDQMDGLVQSALAHLRDGRSDEPMTAVDLTSLAQTVADHFADMGHDLPVASAERLAVRGRPSELERALTNLADNACKYGRAPRIALTREADQAVLAVIDAGPGIPPERRAELTEPFVRGDAARTMNQRDGFGLGLTIARTIAEAHGGRLEFLDRPAGEFSARLVLPLNSPKASNPANNPAPRLP